MRRVSVVIAVAAAIAGSYALGRYNLHPQSATGAVRHPLYYVDPMHPAYRSDTPGTAPDCGMPLEPVYAEGMANAAPAKLPEGAVAIDGTTQRLLGIQLATVGKNATTHVTRVVGRVLPEDTRVYDINSGVDGFIRQTFDDSVGLYVKQNQKLATYYSPDFLAVASGFLAASANVPGSVGNDGSRTVPFPGTLSKQGVSSLQGYADRLRNLGMSDVQINEIAQSRQLPESIDIVAPTDGFIVTRNVSPGEHFEHAMKLYRIADLSRVWVVAEVDEWEALYLHPGNTVQIALKAEGRQLRAYIAASLPQSDAGGGTVKLRMEVENSTFTLRPDMLIDVDLPIHLPPAVTVPVDALIDSGARARVYVERGPGVFEPRDVQTGWRFGGQVEILQGLQPGERVVAEATFLVDSESRLKSAASEDTPARLADRSDPSPPHVTVATTMQ